MKGKPSESRISRPPLPQPNRTDRSRWFSRRPLKSGTPREPSSGVRVWSLSARRATVNYVEMQPGAATEIDRHTNEQINYILDGTVDVLLGNGVQERLTLGTGDAVVIPSNVRHQFVVTSPDSARFIGIISPARRS